MNITTTGGNTGLVPQGLDQAMRLAEMMARSKMVPQHFQGSPGDCLMVVEQAMRWNMSPFAVAQCAASVKGKLCYEGKLIAAVVASCGAIVGEFDYKFTGSGKQPETLSVVASAKRVSDGEVKTVEVAWKDARTSNEHWAKSPEQMLCYHAARVWARRWTPGPMLGVYAREEFDAQGNVKPEFAGPTIEGEAAVVQEPAATPEPPKRTARQWLDELERDLSACRNADDVDAIIATEDVERALDKFTNGLLERLKHLLADAQERYPAFVET